MKRTITNNLPDLSRTKQAIEAYGRFNDAFTGRGDNDAVIAAFAELDRLAWEVGHAYGLDTADRNSLSDCEGCIRPGHKVPGPGCELSFVRRMVRDWEPRHATA